MYKTIIYLKLEKEQIYLFQKWCTKVVNNNQRGSPSLTVNLALNEILVHKVGVDLDTPIFIILNTCVISLRRERD